MVRIFYPLCGVALVLGIALGTTGCSSGTPTGSGDKMGPAHMNDKMGKDRMDDKMGKDKMDDKMKDKN
jgi:hypothetical protein